MPGFCSSSRGRKIFVWASRGVMSEPTVHGGHFGLGEDLEPEDCKDPAEQPKSLARAKKPKLTHEVFFEDHGLKKVVRDFPWLKFQGKGHEFDDLKILMGAYKKWLKDLYPFNDDFEDLIWKAREVLQTKEKKDVGESDPKQHLHHLRLDYKCGKISGKACEKRLDSETAQRVAENRRKALERKRQVEAKAKASGLDSETAKRVAENRAKALEKKRQRDEAQLQDEEFAAFADPFDETFEDVFDFGGME